MYLYAWTHRYSRGFSPSAVFALTTLFKKMSPNFIGVKQKERKNIGFLFQSCLSILFQLSVILAEMDVFIGSH